MNIDFSIISRGTMLVNYGDKKIYLSGELTFSPPVFYADLKSINRWEPPFENIELLENEKKELIEGVIKKGESQGMKIVFD